MNLHTKTNNKITNKNIQINLDSLPTIIFHACLNTIIFSDLYFMVVYNMAWIQCNVHVCVVCC